MKIIFLIPFLLLLVGCTNPLNQATYKRYNNTGAMAEREMNVTLAETSYSRALKNVYMGNLGPELEAEALFNLGRLERVNGKLDLSLKHLLKSLEIDEKTNKAGVKIIKNTLAEIAKTYYEKAKYKEGVHYLDRIYTLDKNLFYSNQSERFIKKLFLDYANKLNEIGLTEKASFYLALMDK